MLGIQEIPYDLALAGLAKHTAAYALAFALCRTEYLMHFDIDIIVSTHLHSYLTTSLSALQNASSRARLFAVSLDECQESRYLRTTLDAVVPLPGRATKDYRQTPRKGFYLRYDTYMMQGAHFCMRQFLVKMSSFRSLQPIIPGVCRHITTRMFCNADGKSMCPLDYPWSRACIDAYARDSPLKYIWQHGMETLISLRLTGRETELPLPAFLGPGSVEGACVCQAEDVGCDQIERSFPVM